MSLEVDPVLDVVVPQTSRLERDPVLDARPGGRWELQLGFEQPRSLNDRRGHWAEAHSRTNWREKAAWAAKAAKLPHCQRIRVSLYYTPKVRRRRDPDNLVSSLKPCIDGLVDAGVVDDDTQDYVERIWPLFREPARECPGGRFLLVVEQLE